MKEYLFRVTIRHRDTNDKIHLNIWATNVDEATQKLCGTIIGYDCEYLWLGSGPVYENNEVVTRMIEN